MRVFIPGHAMEEFDKEGCAVGTSPMQTSSFLSSLIHPLPLFNLPLMSTRVHPHNFHIQSAGSQTARMMEEEAMSTYSRRSFGRIGDLNLEDRQGSRGYRIVKCFTPHYMLRRAKTISGEVFWANTKGSCVC
jgi:hypothetical protein